MSQPPLQQQLLSIQSLLLQSFHQRIEFTYAIKEVKGVLQQDQITLRSGKLLFQEDKAALQAQKDKSEIEMETGKSSLRPTR